MLTNTSPDSHASSLDKFTAHGYSKYLGVFASKVLFQSPQHVFKGDGALASVSIKTLFEYLASATFWVSIYHTNRWVLLNLRHRLHYRLCEFCQECLWFWSHAWSLLLRRAGSRIARSRGHPIRTRRQYRVFGFRPLKTANSGIVR